MAPDLSRRVKAALQQFGAPASVKNREEVRCIIIDNKLIFAFIR